MTWQQRPSDRRAIPRFDGASHRLAPSPKNDKPVMACGVPARPSAVALPQAIILEMDNVDVSRWGADNWRLHAALHAPAHRPTIMRTLERIHETFDRYIRLQITLTDGRWRVHADHQRILDACREPHVDVATALLRQHITKASSALDLTVR